MLLALPLHVCLDDMRRASRALRNWLTKTDPVDPARMPDDMLEKELQRLVETSPHLLCDIGFTEMKQREEGKRVFRRGGVRIAV